MLVNSQASKLWICLTRHQKNMSGKMIAEAAANNLHVEPIPEELKRQLSGATSMTTLHIPFAKMTAFPQMWTTGCPRTCNVFLPMKRKL